MARNLSSDMKIEVTKEVVTPIFLIKMEFADGDLNLWTGYGDFEWNGETYTGTGTLLAIDKVEEAADLRAVGVTYTLTGVPIPLRSLALNASNNIQGGNITMWLGCLWGNAELVADPYQLFKGRMDTMTLRNSGTACTIQLSAESVLIDLERPRVRYYTPEDIKLDYPTDTFFDYVVGLQDKQIQWGRG